HGHDVSDIVGGLKHGVAKRANIYGVSIPKNENGKFNTLEILKGLQYILNKMLRPNKTVINISLG
ncbi:hypothetical protein PIROE2DRAFT_31253, partial [Piromyces sp. E2]